MTEDEWTRLVSADRYPSKPVCAMCREEHSTDPGADPSMLCNPCAHQLIPDLIDLVVDAQKRARLGAGPDFPFVIRGRVSRRECFLTVMCMDCRYATEVSRSPAAGRSASSIAMVDAHAALTEHWWSRHAEAGL